MVVIKEVMSVNQVNDGGILKSLLKGFLGFLKHSSTLQKLNYST